MKILALVLLTVGLTAFALPAEQELFARNHARSLGREFQRYGLPRVAQRVDESLDHLVTLGISKLREAGDLDADRYESQWYASYQGYVSLYMMQGHDIGDHAPLVKWLADFYDHLVSVLGVQICIATHLSSIEIFNFGLPVAFRPCTFDMDSVSGERIDEYRRHFAKGDVYYGVASEATYWVVDIACMVASQGTGVVWLCGTIGNIAEKVMGSYIAPGLSDRIYNGQCGQ